MKIYNQTIDGAIQSVHSNRHGLSSAVAKRRLHRYGSNEVKVVGIPLWQKALEPFANVMIMVLAVAAGLSLWQKSYLDAVIILAIIMASVVIDWAQQYSTSRILRRLREKENDKVEVLRSGNTSIVPSEELVVGDVVMLYEGQKIPADARVIETSNLHVDESMLTGESLSVAKTAAAIHGDKEVYDQTNMVFSGSFVVAGIGQALVIATANGTEFGKLAQLTSNAKTDSPIQRKINRLIRGVILIVAVLTIMVLGLQLVRGHALIDSLQFGLAFAVSAVPESLPIAIMAILAMGMKRMANRKALVRNMRAIENIGLTTVIATDKTGTLTQNKLYIQDTWSPVFNSEAFALQVSFSLNGDNRKSGDPLDQALYNYLKQKQIDDPTKTTKAEKTRVLPFDYLMAMSGNVWRFGSSYSTYLKGAPEKIISRCHLNELKLRQANEKLAQYASCGFRVIAYARLESKQPVVNLSDLMGLELEFLGFTAVADQLRPKIGLAVRAAQAAGIKVCMITGDHPATAFNIAETIGIASNSGQVYDSYKLAKLPADKLAQVVRSARVYARVTPQTKHELLRELNKQAITAMTGDGVNDVPALTRAHVGIAMGSGSAIAKDASDMVLLDDNFRSIVVAIKEGRTIVANIRRMLVYLLATNAGEVLVTLGALILGLPIPLVAVQILWINLATDTFMVIPLGVEPSRSDVMHRQPDRPNTPILDRYMIGQTVVSAVSMATITLATFIYFRANFGLASGRTAVFVVLIVIQWANALVMRGSESIRQILRVPNKVFSLALVSTIILQVIVMTVPSFREALHLADIRGDLIVVGLVAAIISVAVLEIYKHWLRKINSHKSED